MRRLLPLIALPILLAACATTAEPSLGDGSGMVLPVAGASSSSAETLEDLLPRADKGDRMAAFTVGAMYHDGDGAPKDLAKAKKYFLIAANANERRAQFNLGLMALTGEGGKADPVEARKWLEKSASGGNPRAPYQLGLLYYQGTGTEKDFAKSKDYFEQSAMLGLPEAQYNLAVQYIRGEGTAQDLTQAYTWMVVARIYGYQSAIDAIPKLEPELTDAQKEEAKKQATALSEKIETDKALRAAGATSL